MKKTLLVILLSYASTSNASESMVRSYIDDKNNKVIVCKDVDGFLITKHDGASDSDGTGSSFEIIVDSYDLKDTYTESKESKPCKELSINK